MLASPAMLGHISPAHGDGAVRIGADGAAVTRPAMQVDGDWRMVGWVTSAGYGHQVGLSLAQGYIPAALAGRIGSGHFEVEILGARCSAHVLPDPPFDPTGARMRG